MQTRPKTAASMWSRPTAYRPRSSARWGRPRADRQKDRTPRHRAICAGVPFCMRRWRCASRFGPWGKGVRTGPRRQFVKRYFYFGQKRAILYNRIGKINSSGDVRQLQGEQFCRTNSHPARGRKCLKGRVDIQAVCEPTHTPQGDVNKICRYGQRRPREPTHTPQGDVNESRLNKKAIIKRTNSHPARGR